MQVSCADRRRRRGAQGLPPPGGVEGILIVRAGEATVRAVNPGIEARRAGRAGVAGAPRLVRLAVVSLALLSTAACRRETRAVRVDASAEPVGCASLRALALPHVTLTEARVVAAADAPVKLKETTDAARAIVRAFTARAPVRSYFTGCSDGGREALMEAQRYPDDFDGIIAQAPANDATRLFSAMAWNVVAVDRTPGSHVSPAKLRALQAAALRACGDAEGVIEDPLAAASIRRPSGAAARRATRASPMRSSPRCAPSTTGRGARAPASASSPATSRGRRPRR
jgi:hypothetical protein